MKPITYCAANTSIGACAVAAPLGDRGRCRSGQRGHMLISIIMWVSEASGWPPVPRGR
jgi:hypothetical protein